MALKLEDVALFSVENLTARFSASPRWVQYEKIMTHEDVFVGEAATKSALMSAPDFNIEVGNITQAACEDISTIIAHGHQPVSEHLRPRLPLWINEPNGFPSYQRRIQHYIDSPSASFAAYTAAGWASKLVGFANAHPERAEELKTAIDAAHQFVTDITSAPPQNQDRLLIKAQKIYRDFNSQMLQSGMLNTAQTQTYKSMMNLRLMAVIAGIAAAQKRVADFKVFQEAGLN